MPERHRRLCPALEPEGCLTTSRPRPTVRRGGAHSHGLGRGATGTASLPRIYLLVFLGVAFAPRAFAAGEKPRPAEAVAGKRPTLAVVAVPLGETHRAAARLSHLGEQVTRRLGRHVLADLADLIDPGGAKSRAEKAQEAKYEYDMSKKFYDDLDVGKAAEHCDRALTLYERSDLSRHFDGYTQSWILKIASLIANADMPTAQAELSLLIPLDPRTAFDHNIFAPDFVSHVKKRRDDMKRQSTLSLDVNVSPMPARVYIDGLFRGVSPVELRNLSAGDHFLTLIAPGYQTQQKRIRAGTANTTVETMEPASQFGNLTSSLSKIRGDARGSGRNVAARELAQNLKVDQILVLVVSAAKERGQLKCLGARVDAKDGHELSYLDEILPDDEVRFATAADSFLSRIIGADLKRTDEGKAVVTTGGGFEWGARHTGYALLGVAAAAVGSGAFFGLQAKGRAAEYKSSTEVQTNGVYDTLEKAGKRSALIADLSYLGAVIAGGSGLFLAVTGRGGGQADDANQNLEERRSVSGTRSRADEPSPARDARARPARDDDDEAASRKDPSPASPKVDEPRKKPDERKPKKKEEEYDDFRDDG